MLGGVVNLVVFYDLIVRFERVNGIVDRTAPNGVLSAMIFGEYTPNPGIFGAGEDFQELYSPLSGMFIEMLGTMILMFMILALTDDRQRALVHKDLAPLLIGFTVAVLIAVYGPITQAGWNPARDFGPRFIAWIAGWGKTAIPGPRNDFWVYIIGPMIGAPLGGFLYDKTLAKGLPEMIVKMDYCKIVDECRDESKIA
jgi:glycerol uptake facilitator-like aquaporin